MKPELIDEDVGAWKNHGKTAVKKKRWGKSGFRKVV